MADQAPPRRWPVLCPLGLGIPAVLTVGVAVVWDWNWFIPLIEPRVSAAIGRNVTLAHLHVHLGRRTRLVANDVQVANPDGFTATTPFARVAHLGITVDVVDWVLHRQIDIPLINLDHPILDVAALPSGQDDYGVTVASGGAGPASNDVTGTLADPTIRSQAVPLLERRAAAVALSFVAPPLALLAIIQLRVDGRHDCAELIDEARQEGRAGIRRAPGIECQSARRRRPVAELPNGRDRQRRRCDPAIRSRRAGPDCSVAALKCGTAWGRTGMRLSAAIGIVPKHVLTPVPGTRLESLTNSRIACGSE